MDKAPLGSRLVVKGFFPQLESEKPLVGKIWSGRTICLHCTYAYLRVAADIDSPGIAQTVLNPSEKSTRLDFYPDHVPTFDRKSEPPDLKKHGLRVFSHPPS